MKTIDDIRNFLTPFISWASDQSDVQAVALVGSYARGAGRDDSDVDLVILTDEPTKYLDDFTWIERFGPVQKHATEEYGKLISVRVFDQNGMEVEYGITTPDWAATPLDKGTRQVIRDGMIVLLEHGDVLSRHVKL